MSEDQVPAQPAQIQRKTKRVEQVVAKGAPVKWEPTFQGMQEFVSHLFQLEVTKMLKKVVLGKGDETIQESSHDHFFHTIDSSGKVLDQSVPVGGHFHIMTVTTDPVTGEPKATCSGPKTFTHNKKGRKVLVDLPAIGEDQNGNPVFDSHTHEVNYVRSSRVRPRTVNSESVKIVNKDASQAVAIPGIKG